MELSPEIPPESEAARAADMLLQGYPGPALRLSGERIVASNAAAAPLMYNLAKWWPDVELWLQKVLEQGPRGPIVVRFQNDSAPMAMEWTASLFPDHQTVLLGRNVTVHETLATVLSESRERFRDIVELSSDLAWETNSEGCFTYIAGGRSLGYMPEELIGKRARDFVARRPMESVQQFETRVLLDASEVLFKRADGSVARIAITAVPLKTPSGQWRGARGICHDVTHQVEQREELDKAQRRDRMIAKFVRSLRDVQQAGSALEQAATEIQGAMQAMGCRIYAADTAGDLRFVAEAGMAPPEVVNSYNRRLQEIGRKALHEDMGSNLVMGTGTWSGARLNGAIWVWRASEGRADFSWSEIDQQLLCEVADHLGVALAQFDYQERLRVMSECDPLTGLLNRRTFVERLTERAGTASPQPSALFYLDLDNFKAVNDSHGHQRGDIVIKRLGDILRHIARPGDLAGRMGGDEFVMWLNGVDTKAAEDIAKRLIEGGAAMRDLSASPDKPLGISVGITVLEPGLTRRATTLIELADGAMYKAKQSGKSNWSFAREMKF